MIHHSAVSLDYLEEHGYNPTWFGVRGNNGPVLLTRDAVRQEVERFRAEGLTYWPTCDNVRKDGRCAGHEKE